MKPFSLLIKPAGADCNLRCRYCFYLGRQELYPERTIHRMDERTLTLLVRRYLALPFPAHTFAFQGGEPLLMGEAFYRKLLELQRRYARPGSEITNCIQTNCTLMTPSLAEFLTQEHVLVGVSVDGPEAAHNEGRPDVAGGGSHAMVMRGLETLKAAGTEHNILTLVSQSNVHDPVGTYRYLRDTLDERFLQFIECVEFDGAGKLLSYAITPDEWADFICAVFDEWYAHDAERISVRLFDSIVSRYLTGVPNSCAMDCDCRSYFVVEHNGDIYPCDFFVRPETKLGNVTENDWEELWDHPFHTFFGGRKRQWNAECDACPYLRYCQGDCPKNRAGHNPSADPRTLSFLCPAWKRIYAHILPKLEKLGDRLKKRRRQAAE